MPGRQRQEDHWSPPASQSSNSVKDLVSKTGVKSKQEDIQNRPLASTLAGKQVLGFPLSLHLSTEITGVLCPFFYVGARNLNSGPHAHVTNTLLIKPSHQLPTLLKNKIIMLDTKREDSKTPNSIHNKRLTRRHVNVMNDIRENP